MNYKITNKIRSANEVIEDGPLTLSEQKSIKLHRQEIQDILVGLDNRLIMIVGPCSAWPKTAVLDYAARLATLNHKVKLSLKIVMRAYVQKPRTKLGWLGPAIQPDPFAAPNINAGITYTRQLMQKIAKMGLPIASEILFTHSAHYFTDLLAWACLGARSTEDQEHRIFASAVDCPIGLKNPTHGATELVINSIASTQQSHIALLNGHEVKTRGNRYAHAVLRGINKTPNFSIKHLASLQQHFSDNNIKHPAVIIDASHDNCFVDGKKNFSLQPNIVFETMTKLYEHTQLKSLVKGFMLESFLMGGNQSLDEKNPSAVNLNGLSITDPCLSWEQTETFLLELADFLQKKHRLQLNKSIAQPKQLYHVG